MCRGSVGLVKRLFNSLTSSKSPNPELARQEFILNVVLVGASLLALVAYFNNLFTCLFQLQSEGALSPRITFSIFLFFLFLLKLSKAGHFKAAARALITIFFLSSFYTVLKWGVDVPQAQLTFALIIVISGIITSMKFTFNFFLMVTLVLLLLSFLQSKSIFIPDLYWRNQPNTLGDTFLLVSTLAIIMLTSWLYNSEIRKALKRARLSESALRRERDLLEVKVEERTRELKREQLERLGQIYRFAEFGRLASGLFHDLANPINLVSLNLETLNDERATLTKKGLVKAKTALERAMEGMKRLEWFVNSARKQLQSQSVKKIFSLDDEINDVINMFSYKCQERKISISFTSPSPVKLFGSPLRFTQLITNLIANAIDSYDSITRRTNRQVEIKLQRTGNNIRLTVSDRGKGIPKGNLNRVFEPFFTTKSATKGIGIGLSICKDIVEKDFSGSVTVESKKGQGTAFVINFKPKRLIAQKPNPF
jgi:signal transduction histidine kinase